MTSFPSLRSLLVLLVSERAEKYDPEKHTVVQRFLKNHPEIARYVDKRGVYARWSSHTGHGVNPDYGFYSTPQGNYAVPFTAHVLERWLNVEYGSHLKGRTKFIQLYRIDKGAKVLNTRTYSTEDYARDYNLLTRAGVLDLDKSPFQPDAFSKHSEHPFAEMNGRVQSQGAKTARNIWMDILGYDVIVDSLGQISYDIEHEVVVFNPGVIRPIVTVSNRDLKANI